MLKKSVIGLILVSALGVTSVLAAWLILTVIDVPGNIFETAPVAETNVTIDPETTVWFGSTQEPGDQVYGEMFITNNDAVGSARYALVAEHTDMMLAAGLRVNVLDYSSTGFECDPLYLPDGTPKTAGIPRYEGPLDQLGFGDPAQGAHAGDVTLTGGDVDRLCIGVMLPSDAPVGLASLSNDTTLHFHFEPIP